MKVFRWLRKWRRNIFNKEEGREMVGVDKYGNKYFQYYSHIGLPTRREIHAVDNERLTIFEDTAFFWWLRKQKDLPPTKGELKLYYEDEKERVAKAIHFNKESRMLDNQYYEKKRLEDELWESRALTEEEFEPEEWTPVSSKKQTPEKDKKILHNDRWYGK